MIAFFAGHPTAANLLMVLFLLMGMASVPSILRETMPDFASSEVEVRIIYPGATTTEVEETVCQRVEDALDGVNDVEEIRADNREGLCIITLEMKEKGDFQTFYNDIVRGIDGIDDFPDHVEDPVIRELGTTDLVMEILVSGPVSIRGLKAYCEDLKDRMLENELSLIEVGGFSDHQLRVTLVETELRRTGLTVEQVAGAISAQSRSLPLGTIETGDLDILLRFDDQRTTIGMLKALVVLARPDGRIVRLSDIADIEDIFEFDEQRIEVDEKRAGLLRISKTKSEDSIVIADMARSFIEDERCRHPQLTFHISRDESLILRDRLKMLISNGYQGLILVFLVMWIFFNVRVSFWVTMGLPVSFLGAFVLVPKIGLTVNMFTMVGLLLALGLLMDDAIVIAENIATHQQRGKDALSAVTDGTKEVAAGVFSSFLTTIGVLGPLAFITGQIGRVLRVVPMILLLVLAVSLIEAFVILPAHLRHALHDHDGKKQNRYRKRIDGFVEWLRIDCMGRAVNFLLPHRKLVFTSILSVFILSIGLIGTGRIKIQGFPELEGDVVVARLLMSEGTPLGRTESVVGSIHQALEKTNRKFSALQPQGKELVDIACVEFGTNVDAYSSGAHTATITVGLLSAEKRLGTIDEYLTYWREEIGDIPDIVSLTISEPGFGPAGRAIEVRLRGKNLTELKDAANDLQAWMHQYKGVINLTHDMRVGKPEISLKMREESYGLGITAIQAARQISAAFKGITVDDIQIGSESYEIDVRLADYDTNSLQKLENFILISNGGQEIPLINVAEWKMARGWAHIGRFNGMRSATITGDVDTRLINVNELMSLMKKRFLPAFSQKYPQTQLTIAGELEQTSLTRMSMLRALLIGIVVIFVLLSFQFKSYTEPFIVMIAIPFTLIGVIWGHLFMGIPVSMPSLMGFIALAGVVVNDSILLVLFLKNSRARGNSIVEAAGRASRERFRAVLLTSSTTIAGVLPILLEKSLQAQILKPLVISTAFGIAASTLLVLLGLPCMYLLLNDLGLICEE